MDAITLLTKHHRRATAALKKLCRAFDADLLDRFASELAAHMVIEETIFYPTVRRMKLDLILESYEEHALARYELQRLLATPNGDEHFEARATALLDLLDRHIDVEEGELFPKVHKMLDDETLELLGDELEKMFDELVERGHDAVLPSEDIVRSEGIHPR
jgi:hemerythrin-like domain-containing protein